MHPNPSDIAFTPSVKAIQTQKGSRSSYSRMEMGGSWETTVSEELHSRGTYFRLLEKVLFHCHQLQCQWFCGGIDTCREKTQMRSVEQRHGVWVTIGGPIIRGP